MTNVSLTCNFTLVAPFDAEVMFESGGSANYGGQITIPTGVGGGGVQPVTTGLWDSDGNVFFTIYDADAPSTSCTINSGSNPGSFDPYVVVAESNGLACEISAPVPAEGGVYDYQPTLSVSPSPAPTPPASPLQSEVSA